MKRWFWLLVVGIVLFISGCGSQQNPVVELRVFAASSLQDALSAVGEAWQEETGIQIEFNFASSNTLAQQLIHGAGADLFFSADEAQMDRVEQEGLLEPGSRKALLSNRLVVILPADSRAKLDNIEQLKQSKFDKIAMGDPEAVPAGVYARKYLEKVGLWNELKERVVPAVNVRAALALVASGAAPAGFVYQTDAAINNQVRIAMPITGPDAPHIVYPVAILQQNESKLEAVQFLEYCTGSNGRKIFEQFGFLIAANGETVE